jgi:hypothetical protein
MPGSDIHAPYQTGERTASCYRLIPKRSVQSENNAHPKCNKKCNCTDKENHDFPGIGFRLDVFLQIKGEEAKGGHQGCNDQWPDAPIISPGRIRIFYREDKERYQCKSDEGTNGHSGNHG